MPIFGFDLSGHVNQLSGLVFLPELTGRHIFALFEYFAQTALAGEANVMGDFRQGQVGVYQQQVGRPEYALLIDENLPSEILNTFNTVIVSAANILYNEDIPASEQMTHWTGGIIHDWPITFVVFYFAEFIAECCGKLVAEKYTKHG